jgi:tetratricopeptide (TPR) repeat protein
MNWLKAATLQFPRKHFDSQTAKSVLLEAMKFYPLSANIVYNLGLAHHLNSEYHLAISFYEQAIDLDREIWNSKENDDNVLPTEFASRTDIPSVWASMGTALFSLGELQKAHDSFDKAYQYEPNNAIMLANWAKLLCLEGVAHYNEGMQLADKAKTLDGANQDVIEANEMCHTNKNKVQEEL